MICSCRPSRWVWTRAASLSEPDTFLGYRRGSRVGVRNLVSVLAAADNMNPAARRLGAEVAGVTVLEATFGRGQLGQDLELTRGAAVGLASHPNNYFCLVVCFEPESGARIAERAREVGARVEVACFLELGGLSALLQAWREPLAREVAEAALQERVEVPLHELVVGLECGGSDASSGLVSNPAIGIVVDRLLSQGGTAVFSEPVECVGLEDVLIERALTPDAGRALATAVQRYEAIALAQGVDLIGTNPTPDNIRGGLSTLEEKSLGAMAKTGSSPINGLLDFAQSPPTRGLWMMEAPAAAVENLTALGAGSCHLILFATGSGNPVGCPLAPTIKICANPDTCRRMAEHVDVDLEFALGSGASASGAPEAVLEALRRTASGALVSAERLGFNELRVSRFGLSV